CTISFILMKESDRGFLSLRLNKNGQLIKDIRKSAQKDAF
ncbi:hypothetical protein, partial [Bacillus altitudinis]